jgi:ATP-binding cassette subfamily C protein LapB
MAENKFHPPGKDSLQNALMYLMAHYRMRHSLESLVNGLPLKKDGLTAQLFVRAAQRAGLQAQVVDRKAEDLSPHTLPATVYLKEDTFAILQEVDPEGAYHVVDMKTGKKHVYTNAEDFAQVYGGFTILTRPVGAYELGKEGFTTGREWFWGVVSQFKNLYLQVALAAVLINLLALVSPLFIMNVYDRVVPNAAFETLWVLAIGVLLAYGFDFLFRQLRSYFIDTAGKGADILLASRIYQQVLNIRQGQRQSSAGAFANQLREFETLRDFFTSTTLVTLIDLPFVFFFIFIISTIGGPVALVPLFAVPVVLFVSFFVQMPLQTIVQQAAHDMDNKHGHLVETIVGLETIKALGIQGAAQAKWEQFVGMTARLGTRARFLAQLGVNFALFAQQVVTVLVIIWGVYRIAEGDMTIGALVASTILVGRTMAPLSQAVALYVRYQHVAQAMLGLSEIMAMDVERRDGQNFVHIKELKGEIQARDLGFTYPSSKLDSLMALNFKISPGERVGIVGRAGSGKSTLTKLLMNIYLPSEGSLLIDGLEIRQMDPAELRGYISYVPQNNILFRGTLRDNLLLGNPDATNEHLVQAAEMSGVIDFARRHPMGFDMPIGEGGEGLSVGQRQAVGVARAVLKDGPLVILDDPTSEMDARSEENIKQGLSQRWLKKKTLILVTHRAPMLDLVDRLIVMDYGKILADGPKKDVLEALRAGKVKGRNE